MFGGISAKLSNRLFPKIMAASAAAAATSASALTHGSPDAVKMLSESEEKLTTLKNLVINGGGNLIHQTPLFHPLSAIREDILATREGVQFERNQTDDGKMYAFFRAEDLQSINYATRNGRVPPLISHHTGTWDAITIRETGGAICTRGCVSLTVDQPTALRYGRAADMAKNHDSDNDVQDVPERSCVMVCVPDRMAWLSRNANSREEMHEYECVSTGLKPNEILGTIHHKVNDDGSYTVEKFEINPRFSQDKLKKLCFDEQMIPAFESLEDSNLKEQLMGQIDRSISMHQIYESYFPEGI